MSNINCIDYPVSFNGYHHVISNEFQETCHPVVFAPFIVAALEGNNEVNTKPIKISDGQTLYIGTELSTKQKQ